MKIYIVHERLLDETNKSFYELTNEEIINLCENDCYGDNYSVFDSIEELAGYWNTDEIFYPNVSYMRVIND